MAELVAVTGPDGSGKSTLCAALAANLAEAGSVVTASIWDSFRASSLPLFSDEQLQTYLVGLNGTARCFFLMHALQQALHLALEKNPSLVLFDGYWYKYGIAELLQDAPEQLVWDLAGTFPRPALVLYLDLEPTLLVERKKRFSLYEARGLEAEYFLSMQWRARSHWQTLSRQEGWQILDAQQTPEQLLSQARMFLAGVQHEGWLQ